MSSGLKKSLSYGDFKLNPFVGHGRRDGGAEMRARFQMHESEISEELKIGMHVLEVPVGQFGQGGNGTGTASPDQVKQGQT